MQKKLKEKKLVACGPEWGKCEGGEIFSNLFTPCVFQEMLNS